MDSKSAVKLSSIHKRNKEIQGLQYSITSQESSEDDTKPNQCKQDKEIPNQLTANHSKDMPIKPRCSGDENVTSVDQNFDLPKVAKMELLVDPGTKSPQ